MLSNSIKRRDALKKIGASAAGTAVLGTGTAAAGGKLSIFIWPQRDSDTDEVDNEVFDALAHFLLQLQDEGALSDLSLTAQNETLKSKYGITYDDSKCDDDIWFSDFQQAIENDSFDEDVHVAVTDQSNFANASGECWGANGPAFAWVGTEGGYPHTTNETQRYKNLAKQEVGHVIINEERIPNDDDLDHPEHALGLVTDTGDSTPMVTFYEETPDHNPCYDLGGESSNGNCSSTNDWDGTHQRDVTQCAVDAVKATHDNDGY